MQDTYLRAVASDAGLWQPLALGSWPGAEPACTQHYAGDWHALYMARAAMPHGFPLAADRVHAVTSAQRAQRQREQASGGSSVQGGLPAVAFEDVMRQVFSAGLACASSRAVRQAPEWRGLKADLAWWAAERPEVSGGRGGAALRAGAGRAAGGAPGPVLHCTQPPTHNNNCQH